MRVNISSAELKDHLIYRTIYMNNRARRQARAWPRPFWISKGPTPLVDWTSTTSNQSGKCLRAAIIEFDILYSLYDEDSFTPIKSSSSSCWTSSSSSCWTSSSPSCWTRTSSSTLSTMAFRVTAAPRFKRAEDATWDWGVCFKATVFLRKATSRDA